MQRYCRRKGLKKETRSPNSTPASATSSPKCDKLVEYQHALPQTVTVHVKTLARGYLLSSYVDPRSRYMSYLSPLLERSRNEGLDAAVSAVALASFSNIHASPETMVKAHTEYASALRQTNSALNDAGSFATDQVLAAVIMLGMFEVSQQTQLHNSVYGLHLLTLGYRSYPALTAASWIDGCSILTVR